jgi:hypothetical protein
MTAIKQRILQIWQNAITPVRICCIKFAQRVVLSQTNTDARVGGVAAHQNAVLGGSCRLADPG